MLHLLKSINFLWCLGTKVSPNFKEVCFPSFENDLMWKIHYSGISYFLEKNLHTCIKYHVCLFVSHKPSPIKHAKCMYGPTRNIANSTVTMMYVPYVSECGLKGCVHQTREHATLPSAFWDIRVHLIPTFSGIRKKRDDISEAAWNQRRFHNEGYELCLMRNVVKIWGRS